MAALTEARHLVAVDVAREALAWDLDTGGLLKRIPYYPEVTALALTPDGETFATAGNDDGARNILEITRSSPADPVASACRSLKRNLTRDEWHQYLGDQPYRATCANLEPEHER